MIFTGTWRDEEDVPFDENAKTIKNTGTCGIAAYRRRRLIKRTPLPPPYWPFPYPWLPFGAQVHQLADEWVHDLPPADVAAWEADAVDGPSKRGTVDRNSTTGWVHWNAAHFAQQYYGQDLPPGLPGGPADQTWTFSEIYYVKPPNQTISLYILYTDLLHQCTSNIFCAYQINPRFVRASNPWRHTRLLAIARMTNFDPGYWTWTGPLRWPVHHGDLVAVYFRGRARWHYNYHYLDTLISEKDEYP